MWAKKVMLVGSSFIVFMVTHAGISLFFFLYDHKIFDGIVTAVTSVIITANNPHSETNLVSWKCCKQSQQFFLLQAFPLPSAVEVFLCSTTAKEEVVPCGWNKTTG